MSIIDKKGINVTSGFKLVSGQPIDARFVVEDETELESLITNGAVYEGLHVWVKSLGKEKVWNGTEFADINFSSSQTPEDDNVVIQQIDTNSKCIKNMSDSIKPYSAENSILNFCNAETRTNKIYFNINLSNEEVEKILGNLFDNNEQKQNWENTYYLGGLYDVEGNLNLYYDIIYFEGDNGEKFFAFEQYDSNNDSTYYNVVWCNEKGKEYINSNYNTNILNSGWQLDYQEYWFDTNMSADYWRISAFKIVENFMALSEFNDVFAEENTIYDIGLKFDLYLIDHNGVISKYDDYIKNNSYYKINWIVADKIPNNNIMPFYGENNTFNIYIVNYRFYGYFPDENNFKIDTDILNWALNEWTEKYFGNNMILFKRNFNDLQELINKGYDNLPAYALIPKNKSNLFISNGEKFERIISESNIFAIKDVESLPVQNNISGTQLQVDGSLPTKIYFNLNATDEDILPILQELQNTNDGSYMGGLSVVITPNFNGQSIDSNLYDTDNINICYENSNDKYIIGFESSKSLLGRLGGYEVIWASKGCNAINSNIQDGWQDWIKNLNGVLNITSVGSSYLTANSEYYIPKLKDIISSAEFKASEGPAKIKDGENKNIFYRTSDQKVYYVKNDVFEELSNQGGNEGCQGGIQSEAIVEVDKLPYELEPTMVPETGFVDKIYFNTRLSPEKVIEVLRELSYNINANIINAPAYFCCANPDMTKGLLVINSSTDSFESYSIIYQNGDEMEVIFEYSDSSGETAVIDNWTGIDQISFNDQNILLMYGPSLGYSVENSKLLKLFSSTEYVNWDNTNINEKVIYKVQNQTDGEYEQPKYVLLDKNTKTQFSISSQEDIKNLIDNETILITKEIDTFMDINTSKVHTIAFTDDEKNIIFYSSQKVVIRIKEKHKSQSSSDVYRAPKEIWVSKISHYSNVPHGLNTTESSNIIQFMGITPRLLKKETVSSAASFVDEVGVYVLNVYDNNDSSTRLFYYKLPVGVGSVNFTKDYYVELPSSGVGTEWSSPYERTKLATITVADTNGEHNYYIYQHQRMIYRQLDYPTNGTYSTTLSTSELNKIKESRVNYYYHIREKNGTISNTTTAEIKWWYLYFVNKSEIMANNNRVSWKATFMDNSRSRELEIDLLEGTLTYKVLSV